MSMFVCLSVHLQLRHKAELYLQNFANTVCGHDTILLLWRYDRLCTSGFVDDVTFSQFGASWPKCRTTLRFEAVCQVAAPVSRRSQITTAYFGRLRQNSAPRRSLWAKFHGSSFLVASSRGCPQDVVRVRLVEYRERHDTRTNGKHYTLQQTADSRDIEPLLAQTIPASGFIEYLKAATNCYLLIVAAFRCSMKSEPEIV